MNTGEEFYVENFQGQFGFLGKCLTNTNQNPVCCGSTGMQTASFIANQNCTWSFSNWCIIKNFYIFLYIKMHENYIGLTIPIIVLTAVGTAMSLVMVSVSQNIKSNSKVSMWLLSVALICAMLVLIVIFYRFL